MLWKNKVELEKQGQKGEGWFAILNDFKWRVRVGVLVYVLFHFQENLYLIP